MSLFDAIGATLPAAGPRMLEFWQQMGPVLAHLRPDDLAIVSRFARVVGVGMFAFSAFLLFCFDGVLLSLSVCVCRC
jgi:hypothetical protein